MQAVPCFAPYSLVFLDVILCASVLADPSWTTTQLTNNSTDDKAPTISGVNVVWDASGEITSNFAGKLADRSNAWGIGSYVDVSGTNAVWQDYDGRDWEIYSNFTGQLTNNDDPVDGGLVEDRRPAVSGTNVVWESNGGIESNFAGHIANSLWSWDPYWPKGHYPDISGTNVVWQDLDANGWQIYSNFAGHLADVQEAPPSLWPPLPRSYPAISGTNVVWASWDGSDWEIYMGTYIPDVVPAPGAVLLGILGLGMAGMRLRRNV